MSNDKFSEDAIKSLKEVVESLAACDYKCEAGPLINNVDFRFLAKIAGVELPTTVSESVRTINDSFSILTGNLRSYLQRRRDEIVEQAKRDVEYWEYEMPMRYRYNYVNFVVNKEKRTVVALLKVLAGSKTAKRGIAKCAPNDCFNSHIGKAIALRRALGLPVPDEYLNAPQPTEVRVGDIVDWGWKKLSYKIADGYRVICLNNGEDMTEYAEIKYAKIIDDSRDDCE